MPDWLTYVLSAWAVCQIAWLAGARNARRYLGAAAIGSVLPDIVKAFYLLKTYGQIDLVEFSAPLHTPMGAVLLAGLVSSFFDQSEMRNVFGYMCVGLGVHLAWDLTLHPYGGGQLLLFPFVFDQYSLGLIWSDSMLPLAIAAPVAAIVWVLRRRRAWGWSCRRRGL